LYKALDRMRTAGLLTAEWEDADTAAREGRPRRRIYAITAAGAVALAQRDGAGAARLGETPA
jgi:DNA-binding PadR family transcriptional regulator